MAQTLCLRSTEDLVMRGRKKLKRKRNIQKSPTCSPCFPTICNVSYILISDWTCYPDRPKSTKLLILNYIELKILSQRVASHSTIQPHGCPWLSVHSCLRKASQIGLPHHCVPVASCKAHRSQDVLKKQRWSKFLIRLKGAWSVQPENCVFAFDLI